MLSDWFAQYYLPRPLFLVAGILWLWMLLSCIRRDPERASWLWMLLVFPVVGGVLYFLGRWLPLHGTGGASWGRRPRRGDLAQAEQAARTIGNPHQFLELGDLLWARRRFDQAAEAYRRALELDPNDPRALWSVGRAALEAGRPADAKPPLQKLMGMDPTYRTGAAALDYGRALIELRELDAAQAHLEADLKRRGDPEARLLLARACVEAGQVEEARSRLTALLDALHGATSAPARRVAREARQLLRRAGARPEAPSPLDGLARGVGPLARTLERRPFLTFAAVSACVVAGDLFWQIESRRRRSRLTGEETRLAEQLGFDLEVVRRLKRRTGGAIQQMVGEDDATGKPVLMQGLQVVLDMPPWEATSLVAELRSELAGRGYAVLWLDTQLMSTRIGVTKNPGSY